MREAHIKMLRSAVLQAEGAARMGGVKMALCWQ
jgi:hypothetical protein